MANRLDGFWQLIGNDDETWDLAAPDGGLTRIAGIGLPPARKVVVTTPTRDGSALAGFTLADREIIIGLMWRAYGTLAARRRRKPYQVLSYLNSPVRLRRTLRDQTCWELRQLDYGGGMEGDSASAYDDAEFAAVAFTCRDPAWYDLDEKSITVNYSDMTHAVYGSSIQLTSADGLYTDGDWYAFPTIAITGPCTDFDLQSTTTSQRLRYYGDIAAGEVVTICTNPHPAYLSAQSDVQGNVRRWVHPDDDFGGFCLWPAPKAAAGCNVWELDTIGMESGSRVEFTWEDRYQGA